MTDAVIALIKPPAIESCFLDSLKKKIIKRLQETGLADAKFKLEVKNVLYVCVLIESALKKDSKINKREFLLDIFRELYGLSADDELNIKNTVEMLHLGKKIKAKSYYKLWCTALFEAFRI